MIGVLRDGQSSLASLQPFWVEAKASAFNAFDLPTTGSVLLLRHYVHRNSNVQTEQLVDAGPSCGKKQYELLQTDSTSSRLQTL